MLRRLALLTTIASVAAGAGLLVASEPAQAAPTVCNGTLSNTTVPADLVVPAGNVCVLNNVTVGRDVIVTDAKQFLTNGGLVNRHVSIDGITDPTLESSLCGTRINGNLLLRDVAADVGHSHEDFFFVGDEDCAPIRVGGSTLLTNNQAGLDIGQSTFGGNLTITDNTGRIEPEENTIGGRLSCSGNTTVGNMGPNTAPVKTGQCAVESPDDD